MDMPVLHFSRLLFCAHSWMFTCQSHTHWAGSYLCSLFFVPRPSCFHRASTLLATVRASDTCSSQFALQRRMRKKKKEEKEMPLHIIPVGCQGNITPQCSVLWRLLEWRYCSIDMYFFLLYLQPHYTEGKVLFLCRKMCVFGLLASVKLNEDRASKLYLSVFVCSFHTTRPDHRAI